MHLDIHSIAKHDGVYRGRAAVRVMHMSNSLGHVQQPAARTFEQGAARMHYQ